MDLNPLTIFVIYEFRLESDSEYFLDNTEYEPQSLGGKISLLLILVLFIRKMLKLQKNHMSISFITRILHHLVLSVFELYLYSDIFSIFKYVFRDMSDIFTITIFIFIFWTDMHTDTRIQKSNTKSDTKRIIHIRLHPYYQLLTTLAWWELGRPKDTWAHIFWENSTQNKHNPQSILSQGRNDAPEILIKASMEFLNREGGRNWNS